MLHASGKFVSSILDFIGSEFVNENDMVQLVKFHELVLKLFKADSDEVKAEVNKELDELIPKVKDLAANFKKTAKKEAEREDQEVSHLLQC